MQENLGSDNVVCDYPDIIGPQFFEDDAQHVMTVNAEQYKVLLENFWLMNSIIIIIITLYGCNKMKPLPTLHE
jgi:hypothetical protein